MDFNRICQSISFQVVGDVLYITDLAIFLFSLIDTLFHYLLIDINLTRVFTMVVELLISSVVDMYSQLVQIVGDYIGQKQYILSKMVVDHLA